MAKEDKDKNAKPKKGFSLKSLIFETDEDKPETSNDDKQEAVQPVPTAYTQPTVYTAVPTSDVQHTPAEQPTPQATSSDTEMFNSHIRQVMEDADIAGPDYLEFMKGLESLGGLNIDEPTKYKAAFATLAAQGVTPEYLVSTANTYIEKLKTDSLNFNDQLAATAKNKEDNLTGGIEAAKTRLAAIAEEIKKLVEEQATLQQQLQKDELELGTMQIKVGHKRTAYETALTNVLNNIKIDVVNIEKHLITPKS